MILSISSGAFCFLFHKLYVHILWLFFYWGCYFYYPQDSSYIISNMLLVSVASISCNVFYMYIHKWNDTIIYFLLLSLSRVTLIIWELIIPCKTDGSYHLHTDPNHCDLSPALPMKDDSMQRTRALGFGMKQPLLMSPHVWCGNYLLLYLSPTPTGLYVQYLAQVCIK